MRRRRTLAALAVVTLGVVMAMSISVSVSVPAPAPAVDPLALEASQRFLNRYVEPDGRVVRRDQGDDTVSEGQADALLLAVATGREDTFRSVWTWTAQHLQRPDGLLSWRWADGTVADSNSAADADLDAARALVLAGERFADAALTAAGLRLGRSILDHETALTPAGRILTAGSWTAQGSPPWTVNPSYASPVAAGLLHAASGDARWADLAAGDRAALSTLLAADTAPPDWAAVDLNGHARPGARSGW